ncbi:MAG: hypothetical protein OZ921_07040 [Sorangiineae bacterium]|nr:hypothetical protein [Polyangiaceae bacterium]MEB2322251.1 hypothetical protein [Sorangiineae bacterium]
MGSSRLVAWLSRHAGALLALVLCFVYLPSLSREFLNYDDPWLVEKSALLQRASLQDLRAIWLDFSRETRLALGAEYLPVRDTSLFIEAHLWGLRALPLRLTNLAIYLGAILLLRAALLRTLESRVAAEGAAWLFALHPVHVESVAWVAGRKDVLALFFVSAALAAQAQASRFRWWLVPLTLALAHLSKAVSVTAILLLVAQDLLARRRLEARLYAPVAAVAAGALYVALEVGGAVEMMAPWPGGSRLATAETMGPVWLRYLASCAWPTRLSLVYDVPVLASWTAGALAGYAVIAGWALGALALLRRQRPLAAASFLWFAGSLAPVSQLIVPLQNLMADRYLLFGVMGPCLLLASTLARWPGGGAAALGGVAALLSGPAAHRASLFARSELIFRDAAEKTEASPIAPYQLGVAFETNGDYANAIVSYREVLRRARAADEVGRRATNNLARALVREGRLGEALVVLERGRERFPGDPKMLDNLTKVLARLGRAGDAQRALEELHRRFPDYSSGARRVREPAGPR